MHSAAHPVLWREHSVLRRRLTLCMSTSPSRPQFLCRRCSPASGCARPTRRLLDLAPASSPPGPQWGAVAPLLGSWKVGNRRHKARAGTGLAFLCLLSLALIREKMSCSTIGKRGKTAKAPTWPIPTPRPPVCGVFVRPCPSRSRSCRPLTVALRFVHGFPIQRSVLATSQF